MELKNIDKIRSLTYELQDEVRRVGYENSVVIGLIKKLNKCIKNNV